VFSRAAPPAISKDPATPCSTSSTTLHYDAFLGGKARERTCRRDNLGRCRRRLRHWGDLQVCDAWIEDFPQDPCPHNRGPNPDSAGGCGCILPPAVFPACQATRRQAKMKSRNLQAHRAQEWAARGGFGLRGASEPGTRSHSSLRSRPAAPIPISPSARSWQRPPEPLVIAPGGPDYWA